MWKFRTGSFCIRNHSCPWPLARRSRQLRWLGRAKEWTGELCPRIYTWRSAPSSSSCRRGAVRSSYQRMNTLRANRSAYQHGNGKIDVRSPWCPASGMWARAGIGWILDLSNRSCRSHTAWMSTPGRSQNRRLPQLSPWCIRLPHYSMIPPQLLLLPAQWDVLQMANASSRWLSQLAQ